MKISNRSTNSEKFEIFFWMTSCLFLCLTVAQEGSQYETTKHHSDSSYFFYQHSEFPRDCKEVRDQCGSNNSSGIYLIKPDTSVEPFEVYCDNSDDSSGWTIIQRREEGGYISFNRDWESYKNGFGFFTHDFFLGNEKISYLTNQKSYELMIEITLTNGSTFQQSYTNFQIGDEFSNYKLVNLEQNSGTLLQFSHFSDCQDVHNSGFTGNRVYKIRPNDWSGSPFTVYCNMTDGEVWTVIQRRVNGSIDFYRDWDSYKEGFGLLGHEFWIGNDKLHFFTTQSRYELRVDLVNRDGAPYYAKFDNFRINDENDNYRLAELGTYSGDAGNAMNYHLNRQFTTYDRDNDANSGNCASSYHGAWWYNDCIGSNLNGDYFGPRDNYRSVVWNYLPGSWYNVKYTEMKIRPFRA